MTNEDGISQSLGWHRRKGTLPKRWFPGGFSYSFFSCCLWSTITLQTAVSTGVIWSRGISAVLVPLLEAPHKPLLRMPDPSNSKSNNWSELGNRLACWHFNEKQLQHSLFTLRLPAPSVWSSKSSSPEKHSPAFLVPALGSSLPFVLFPCYQKPKGHYLMFPSLVHPQLGLHSIKMNSSWSLIFKPLVL